jgi:uncharacterized membrane protein YgdD (TMEM256/DUF423 family)
MTLQILIALAGVMGAAGIVLAAAGAHARPGMGLDSASQMLLFHAPAIVAVCAAIAQGLLSRPVALAAVIAMIVGAAFWRCAPIWASACSRWRRRPAAPS